MHRILRLLDSQCGKFMRWPTHIIRARCDLIRLYRGSEFRCVARAVLSFVLDDIGLLGASGYAMARNGAIFVVIFLIGINR